MSQITLFGGLASTVMWPVGHLLAEWLGWRGAVLAMARWRWRPRRCSWRCRASATPRPRPRPARRLAAWRAARARWLAGALYALIAMLTNFLAAGNAAHLIAILTGLGWRRPRPWAWPRWGVGQFSGRLVDVALGGRLHPLTMTLIVCLLLPLSFALALASDGDVAMLAVYALAYGACNGLLTIARGNAAGARLPQLRRGGGRAADPQLPADRRRAGGLCADGRALWGARRDRPVDRTRGRHPGLRRDPALALHRPGQAGRLNRLIAPGNTERAPWTAPARANRDAPWRQPA